MLQCAVRRLREQAWAREVAGRAKQNVADFEVGDHVRVWVAGSTPWFGGTQPIYGYVFEIDGGSLVVETMSGETMRVDPKITQDL